VYGMDADWVLAMDGWMDGYSLCACGRAISLFFSLLFIFLFSSPLVSPRPPFFQFSLSLGRRPLQAHHGIIPTFRVSGVWGKNGRRTPVHVGEKEAVGRQAGRQAGGVFAYTSFLFFSFSFCFSRVLLLHFSLFPFSSLFF